MRKKFFTAAALAVVIILAIMVAIPIHALFYLHFTEAGNTTRQLEKLLSSLEWSRKYEANEFDCSNMAARLCDELRAGGFRCVLAMDNEHVWVLVRTKEGVQTVEAIYLKTVLSSRTPWYVAHPIMSTLMSPLAEFSYEEEELVAKSEIVSKPTPEPKEGISAVWDAWMGVGNDTLRYKEMLGGMGNSSVTSE